MADEPYSSHPIYTEPLTGWELALLRRDNGIRFPHIKKKIKLLIEKGVISRDYSKQAFEYQQETRWQVIKNRDYLTIMRASFALPQDFIAARKKIWERFPHRFPLLEKINNQNNEKEKEQKDNVE